ncbi:Metallo-hydrolase/oxidoreductase [Paxillus ammoniavirescens]|nr:Metallo-hydrolase/oxidoreductase [Paxillus ammoniavirescens]
MEKLEALASVVRLSDHVLRILGQNPGKFTLQGTNTYLVGERTPYTLIDTGEGKPEYIPLLESALQDQGGDPSASAQQHVSDIIISHWHPDHVGGLPSVLSLLSRLWGDRNTPIPFKPPRIHKFPHASLPDARLHLAVQSIPPNAYTPSPSGSLFHDLQHGQSFPIARLDASSDPEASLQVIHSPGHTEDSICLLFPSDNALYTADTVLGQGTAVFEDLATYISTLRSLLSHRDKYSILYPGHGPVVQNGTQLINTYIEHRMEREGQILQVMQQVPEAAEGSWSTWGIVSKVYANYPQNLWEPAARSVDQHLKKLEIDGRVKRLGGEGKDVRWQLLSRL